MIRNKAGPICFLALVTILSLAAFGAAAASMTIDNQAQATADIPDTGAGTAATSDVTVDVPTDIVLWLMPPTALASRRGQLTSLSTSLVADGSRMCRQIDASRAERPATVSLAFCYVMDIATKGDPVAMGGPVQGPPSERSTTVFCGSTARTSLCGAHRDCAPKEKVAL